MAICTQIKPTGHAGKLITALIFIKVVFVFTFSSGVSANELTFLDPLIQGGMVRGHVAPGTQLVLFDKNVFVDSEGKFVFGLGRDTNKSIEISVNGVPRLFPVEQREYKVQRIEGVDKKYVSPPKSVTKRIRAEAELVWKARQHLVETAYFREGFIWPLDGPVTGVYGSQRVFNGVPKRPHFGLDIAGPVGTVIVAPVTGIVRLAEPDLYYSGGTLVVDHGYGLTSTFIHLHKIYVEVGQVIKQGQEIAEVGATGRVTGPHLDWRINWFNQRLDPMFVLPARKTP